MGVLSSKGKVTGAANMSREQEWIDTINTPERQILDLRMVGMRHALAVGRFRYMRAAPPLVEQHHENWLILQFVLTGQQLVVIDGKERLVRGGEMMRLLPGQRYGTGVWPERRGEMAWLILQYKPMPRGRALGMSSDGIRAIYAMLANPNAPMIGPMPRDTPDLLDSIFEWWNRRDDDLGRETIRNRIGALVLGAADTLSGSHIKSSDRGNELRIQKVLRWMQENPTEVLGSEELAAIAGLSQARFHIHFKRIVGSSPRDHWLRMRVEQAGLRLRNARDIAITDVAHEFGFSSSQYFATVFRRYFGTTPLAYRNDPMAAKRQTKPE